MLKKLLVLNKRRIILNVAFNSNSSNGSIRLTDLFVKSHKVGCQESAEIINMSNDSRSINIPRANDFRPHGNNLSNDIVNASLNERATINLSSNTYANTPEPPNEAINYNDRPYDSIMSLGSCEDRNEKYISEEFIKSHNLSESESPRELSHDHMMLTLYILNEERFDIRLGGDARDKIARGELSVVSALEYQNNVMKEVDKYWHENIGDLSDEVKLFITYPSENNEDVRAVIRLLCKLNISDKEEYVSRFNIGQLPLLSLIDIIDREVRVIVMQWKELKKIKNY